MRLARNFKPSAQTALTPYVGVQFTVVQAEGKERYEFERNPNAEVIRDNSVDFEQDGYLGAHVGLRLQVGSDWTVRGELRVIDQESLSVALGYRF